MEEPIKTMLYEHEPRSLETLCHCLCQKFPEVKIIKINPEHLQKQEIIVDLIFYEIFSQNDLIQIKSLLNSDGNIVAICTNDELILDILKLDLLAIIVPPFEDQNLKGVIEKIKKLNLTKHITNKTESLLHLADVKKSENVVIPTLEGYEIVRINEIIRLEADRSYCNIFLTCGRLLIVSRSLREIESLLPKDIFFRSHQSHLFNVNAMKRYIKSDGGFAVMLDHSRVPVSKLKKDALISFLMK